jgi:predicted PhzF superfamily epimerase YddE/YHI9
MAAAPFGGHPTLEHFLEWARQNGCKAGTKVRAHSISGQPYKVVEITGPQGGRVVIAMPDLQERLAPSQVAHLQRRLGLKSTFAATPEPPDPAATIYTDERGIPKLDD